MATLLDISLYLPLSLLNQILRILRIDEYVFALAVYDSVGSEGLHDGGNGFLASYEAVDQCVVRDLESLQATSSAAQDGTDGRDCLADAVTDRSPFDRLRDRGRDMADHRLEFRHYSVVDLFNLFRRISSDKDAVVLEEDNLGIISPHFPVLLDLVIDLLEKSVAWIRVRNVQCLREEMSAQGFRIP